jgi:hypothetical protein
MVNTNYNTVTCRLKAGIVEQEEAAVARQRRGKHVSVATNKLAIIWELLEEVFPMQSLKKPI